MGMWSNEVRWHVCACAYVCLHAREHLKHLCVLCLLCLCSPDGMLVKRIYLTFPVNSSMWLYLCVLLYVYKGLCIHVTNTVCFFFVFIYFYFGDTWVGGSNYLWVYLRKCRDECVFVQGSCKYQCVYLCVNILVHEFVTNCLCMFYECVIVWVSVFLCSLALIQTTTYWNFYSLHLLATCKLSLQLQLQMVLFYIFHIPGF